MNNGWRHLPGYFEPSAQRALLTELRTIIEAAPFFRPRMPRTGNPFSVEMTNAGPLGWVSDKSGGYRYQATHPVTGSQWPPIPKMLHDLWCAEAEWPAPPEACLINYYAPGAKMGSHRDADEEERRAPVVSVSLGDDAAFHVGGLKRSDPKTRFKLRSGDVVVLGGEARSAYHGVDRIIAGTSALLSEGGRLNLTLRRVNLA